MYLFRQQDINNFHTTFQTSLWDVRRPGIYQGVLYRYEYTRSFGSATGFGLHL
jgi:hypothetical protein